MSASIIEQQSKDEKVFKFLEEDDDFEEFDLDCANEDLYAEAGQADVQMTTLTLQKRDSASNFIEKD